jgi:FdhD protein
MLRSELPHLTQAQAPLTREVTVVNEWGEAVTSTIPCERALTVYVDKRELVTLMTLGGHPELLVLGYLRNQRLVGAAAVKTRNGIERLEERTAKRVVTTGCGQGSVFGGIMDDLDLIHLTPATLLQEQLYGIVNAIRVQDSIYKEAGSVHGCALFQGDTMLVFIEDVGRHNAIDTIAGWMWMGGQAPTLATAPESAGADFASAALPPEGVQFALGRPCGESILGSDKVLYTTGRLTSEMVIKSAQMGIPIAVSRSGITEMGLEVAQRVGLCAIGRATHKRFLCYSAFERLLLQPELAGARLRAVA